MPFSKSEVDTLVAINVVCSALSLVGSLIIIVSFLYFKELRTFAFRLVFFVSCSDFCACVFQLFGDPQTKTLCQLQGFGENVFTLSSFMWVTAIAIVINAIRVKYERFPKEKYLLWCHSIIWPSSLVISILPFFSDSYGHAGGWCWIKDFDAIDRIWRIVCFYSILLLIFCYLVYVYFRLYRYLSAEDEVSNDSQAMLRKVIVFPLVIFVCYFFGFIRRLLEVIGLVHPPFWLAVVHVSTSSLLGLGNAIVYGAINSRVRHKLFQQCCKSSSKSDQDARKDSIIQMEAEVRQNDKTRKVSLDSSVDLHINE